MKMKTTIRNVALYSIVGVSATAVEWLVFFILNQLLGMQYVLATVLATVLSGFTNWAVGRFLMFKRTSSAPKEIGKIYIAGLVSMSFNLLLMWIMVSRIGLHPMAAKVIATLIVFTWNYTIATKVIYKRNLKHPVGE